METIEESVIKGEETEEIVAEQVAKHWKLHQYEMPKRWHIDRVLTKAPYIRGKMGCKIYAFMEIKAREDKYKDPLMPAEKLQAAKDYWRVLMKPTIFVNKWPDGELVWCKLHEVVEFETVFFGRVDRGLKEDRPHIIVPEHYFTVLDITSRNAV